MQRNGTYTQSQYNKQAEEIPTKTDTRQHLRQFYFKKTGATHSHLHKAQRKRKWSLPWFASSHFATTASSPSGVVPRPASAARLSRRTPDSSDRVFGGAARAAPLSRCGRGGKKAGAPLRVTLGKTLSRSPRRTHSPTIAIPTSHCPRARDLH